jgi:type VI secretion system lysozyme-like protein
MERIRAASEGLAANKSPTREELTRSLERHLGLILNTHQGSSESAKDYGMPDFISLSGRSDLDGIREVAKTLSQVIGKYEPRLKSAKVTHVPAQEENGILEFAISATADFDREIRNLYFSTSISPDGKVTVSDRQPQT